jgi:hypothetical protein
MSIWCHQISIFFSIDFDITIHVIPAELYEDIRYNILHIFKQISLHDNRKILFNGFLIITEITFIVCLDDMVFKNCSITNLWFFKSRFTGLTQFLEGARRDKVGKVRLYESVYTHVCEHLHLLLGLVKREKTWFRKKIMSRVSKTHNTILTKPWF